MVEVARSFRCEGSLPPVLPSEVGVTSLPSHARACIVFRRSGDGSRGDRLGTGLQSIQISPYHAGLAGLRCLRLLCAACFAAMLWSLLPVSAPVRRLTFGTFLRFPTRFSGIRFELSRRTARHERTLAAVACTPMLGQGIPATSVAPPPSPPRSVPPRLLRPPCSFLLRPLPWH